MPAHRTPASVLDLTGRLKHDAKRYRDRQQPAEVKGSAKPELAPLGDVPEMRLITFAEAWAEIVAMIPEGVLRKRDRAMVQEAARLHQYVRNRIVMADLHGNPLHDTIDNATSRLYQSYLAKLGASPVDANHVDVAPGTGKKESEFD